MIYLAHTILDAQHIIGLLQEFLKETSYSQGMGASKNIEHLGKLAFTFMQLGFVWLAFSDKKPVGILAALKEPNIWDPNVVHLREMVWYVLPQYRGQTHAGRLFAEYCKKGDQLLSEGKINFYSTTRMSTTTALKLQDRGFDLKEITYTKEK